MQSLAFYLLKVIICSGLLLLYYRFALRNKRFHYYNRFYLLATIAASLLLPLLKVNWFTIHSSNDNALALLNGMYAQGDEVIVTAKKAFIINWQQVTIITYSLISILFAVILLWRIYKIYAFKKKYTATSMGEFDFINTDLTQAPFSFLQNLFWRNDIDLADTTGRQILQHELTHIRQKHTWDKLWMQIILAVFWINPFYWFIQKELFMLHEFIADEKAIENNDGAAFAAMLLTSQYGKSIFSPGQSFAYSPIKRRLFMLTNLTKPRYSYLRRIMVLPLLAIVVLLSAFRLQKINDTDNKQAETTQQQPDQELPVPVETGMAAVDTTPAQIVIEKPADSARVGLSFTSKSLVYGYLTGDTTQQGAKVMLFIDDKEVSTNQLQTCNPSDISSVHVLKDKTATDKYGPRAADGVIEIYTRQYVTDNGITIDNVQLDHSIPEKKSRVMVANVRANDTLRFTAHTIRVTNVQLQKANPADTVIEVVGYQTKKRNALDEVTVTGYPTKRKTSDTAITVVGFARPKKQSLEEVTVTGYSSSLTEQAKFPGGASGWQAFLAHNLHADVITKKAGPPGRYTVIVSFIVDEEGNVSEVRAENDPGYGTAAEAIRVIQHGPNWVPAKQKDKAVKYRQKQAITFVVE